MNNIQISLEHKYTESLNATADLSLVNTTTTNLNSDISKKANIIDVYTKVDSDITTSTLTSKINDKANIIDVYSKTDSDTKSANNHTLIYNAIAVKSNSADVFTKTQSGSILASNNTT